MAISVQMPALGESVTEGTVTRWLKQEGDTVEQDEPLLEVSTDKVDTEIPSPAAGVLKKIIAQEDDTVEVGGELAVIGDGGEAPEEKSAAKEEMVEEETPTEEPDTHPEPATEETEEPQETESKPSAELSASATLVKMPELGESVTEGTVTRWLKKVGDKVEVDEPLVEVSTDKVDTEIPSPVAGTLVSITAEEDDIVPVGGELAKIGDTAPPSLKSLSPSPSRTPSRCRNPSLSLSRRRKPNQGQSLSPNRRRPPRLKHRPVIQHRMRPRWCESWPRRTTLTSRP
jgi:pyruvate dehydrogenase E2 component (dihydrolipoamide acetyltransferase)